MSKHPHTIKEPILKRTFPNPHTRTAFKLLYGAWIKNRRPDKMSVPRAHITTPSGTLSLAIAELAALGVIQPYKGNEKYFYYTINATGLLNAVGEACLKFA